jgi:GNAT superfamily N-acetyltransferase
MNIAIDDEPLLSPVAQDLIARLNAELEARYPEPGATHFRLDPSEVAPGRGAFLVARADGVPAACGAFRVIDLEAPGRAAEIKRMYVAPSARGHGLGRRVLAALEARAIAWGVRRFVLETGDRQREAVRLYERAGYARIAPFGEYVGSTHSVCMAKSVDAPAEA